MSDKYSRCAPEDVLTNLSMGYIDAVKYIRDLEAKLAKAVEALRYYADGMLYVEPDPDIDGGERARKALREIDDGNEKPPRSNDPEG